MFVSATLVAAGLDWSLLNGLRTTVSGKGCGVRDAGQISIETHGLGNGLIFSSNLPRPDKKSKVLVYRRNIKESYDAAPAQFSPNRQYIETSTIQRTRTPERNPIHITVI